VTSKGQITIPAVVRQAMGLKPQDRVVFTLLPDGTTVMRAKTKSFQDLFGNFKDKRRRKVATKNMRIGR
jgi:AbrB family looped-hinge helix DNA binding protein